MDEIHDGEWYHKMIEHLDDGTNTFFATPIIFYIDKNGTDAFQCHGLEPLLFTTSLLNRNAHQKTNAWRVLGYVPDLEQKSSVSKKSSRSKLRTKGLSTRNYHKCLEKILHKIMASTHGYALVNWSKL